MAAHMHTFTHGSCPVQVPSSSSLATEAAQGPVPGSGVAYL